MKSRIVKNDAKKSPKPDRKSQPVASMTQPPGAVAGILGQGVVEMMKNWLVVSKQKRR